MSTPISNQNETDQHRFDALEKEYGPDWKAQYRPGSYGCHELLDRTAMTADQIDQYILSHPACIQNPAWTALAEEAISVLNTLYQQIGEVHVEDEASTD